MRFALLVQMTVALTATDSFASEQKPALDFSTSPISGKS
jgi:hypothetical protein